MEAIDVHAHFAPVSRFREMRAIALDHVPVVDAQFSGPYAAALALTEKSAGMDVFTGVLDRGPSDEFRRLMSVTDVQQADALDAIHPEFWPGRVTIDVGGEKIERYAKHMLGEKERPMAMSGVQAKFRELAPKYSEDVQQAVFGIVDDLENRSVAHLASPLRMETTG